MKKSCIDLHVILKNCCHGPNTTPEEVKKHLLTKDNIDDILNGDIPYRTLKEHIKVWVCDGKNNIN